MKLSEIVLLLLLAVGQGSYTYGSSECESYQYMYTLQPPEAFVCNPYQRGILNLTCAVTGEPVEGIQWYFRRPNGVENIMLTNESSNVTLIPNTSDNYYSLNLVISNLNSNNEGFYWCRGLVQEGDYLLELTSSLEFELLPRLRYIDFPCPPNKAVKSSNVRCATTIPFSTEPPIISSSVPYPGDQVTSMDLLLPLEPTSSVEETLITSTQTIAPSTSTLQKMLTSQPTVASSDEPTPAVSSLQLSDIILYSILALLGFLIFLVLSLSIVISVLCCKKRRTVLEGKEAPYDQFSTQSEALHGTLTLKSLETFPIAPPPPPPYRLPNVINTTRSDTSSSSGVYDEIHTVVSQYGTQPCTLTMAAHEYQEIPEVERGQRSEAESQPYAENREQEPAAPRGQRTNRRQSSYENPYDLPDQLQQSSAGQGAGHPQQATPPGVTSQQNRNYHSLETPSLVTENGDAQSSIDGSSDFTNSNLLVTPPPEDNPQVSNGGRIGPDEIVTEVEVESIDQESATPLPIIPENPYHTLEESASCTSSTVESPITQNKYVNGVDGQTSVSSDVKVQQSQSFPRLQDEGYDRLVGPPHIYHILQKSPSLIRPRVRACSPTSGYHHLDTRMDTGVRSPRCVENGPPSFPLADDTLVLPSEDSSTLSSSEIFDDPQYNFSPKRMISAAKSNTDRHRNSHNGQFTTLERAKIERGIDLSKYRGDYERDPMYMKLIHRLTEAAKQNEPSDDADRLDVSPFLKLPRSHSMSLPDLTHTYQPLEPTTRDPMRDYEMLQKEEAVVTDTNA